MIRTLLIRPEPLIKILQGTKTWEMRGAPTKIRETIGLIPSRSGTVVALCYLVDCIGPLSEKAFRKNAEKAGLRPNEAQLGYYLNTYAWVLANIRLLEKPVPYVHPSGAVIWVRLEGDTEHAIRRLSPKNELRQSNLGCAIAELVW
jgi:hypothetical protein